MDVLLPTSSALPSAAAKPIRRLLLKNLTPPEWAKVVAYLRLAQDRLRVDWEVAAEGDAHVVLYGGEEAETITGLVHEPVLRAHLSAHASAPGDLARPLCYEPLVALLLRAEALLLPVAATQAGGHAPTAAPAVSTAPGAAAAAAAVPAALSAVLRAGETYRLRRWPPAALIKGNRHHLRVATFLSTRAMRLDELVFLSNVDEATCRRFVQSLADAGLLERQGARSAAAPGAKPRTATGMGVLGRIRRAFGLGGAR